MSSEQYWKLDLGREPGRSVEKIKAQDGARSVREKLTESVKRHLVSDGPGAAWLSPGIDSSAIVSIMKRLGHMPAETFTLRCENPSSDETAENPVLAAFPGFRDIPNRMVTLKKTDLSLMPEAVWHGEDPFTSATEIASMVLSREAGRSYKVVLTGEGSDEVFGGYTWYRAQKILKPFLHLPPCIRKVLISPEWLRDRRPGVAGFLSVPERELSLEHFRSMIGCPAFQWYGDAIFSPWIREALVRQGEGRQARRHITPGTSGFRRFQAADLAYRLSNVITHHLDRSSMSQGLEARVPFLDHLFVEHCALIPDRLKLKGFREKHILRLAMKEDLPSEIAGRRKRPMGAPFADWMKGPLPEFALEAFSENNLRATGYFNIELVARFLEEHRSGRRNHGRVLTGILGVQVWDRVIRRMDASRGFNQ